MKFITLCLSGLALLAAHPAASQQCNPRDILRDNLEVTDLDSLVFISYLDTFVNDKRESDRKQVNVKIGGYEFGKTLLVTYPICTSEKPT